MKALIFSDSHGRCDAMPKIWALHRDTTDAIFFLGDGPVDFSFVDREIPLYAVRGNNDFFGPLAALPYERTVTFDGLRLLLCHGHTLYVKSTMAHLIRHAQEIKADAVLYGHVHRPEGQYLNEEVTGQKPLHIFGCGSVGLPYDGKTAYGILETDRKKILLTHAVFRQQSLDKA